MGGGDNGGKRRGSSGSSTTRAIDRPWRTAWGGATCPCEVHKSAISTMHAIQTCHTAEQLNMDRLEDPECREALRPTWSLG